MNKGDSWTAIVIGLLTATIPTALLFLAVTYLFVIPLILGIVCIVLGFFAKNGQGQLGRSVGWIAAILMLSAIVFPFGLIAYSHRSGYPIEFVISDRYQGPIRLIIDREHGVVVPFEHGRYTYRIPANGKLLINDDSPFHRFHSETATYSSGKSIAIDTEGDLPQETAFFRGIGSGVKSQGGQTEEYIEYYLGTKGERTKDPRIR